MKVMHESHTHSFIMAEQTVNKPVQAQDKDFKVLLVQE